MYSLDIINSDKFQDQKVSLGNFERDSSFCITPKGCVIHAASQRSTAFIPSNTEFFNQFKYWMRQSQKAVNAFIEACVGDYSDFNCRKNAVLTTRTAWKFKVTAGGRRIVATRGNVQRIASSWEKIHNLTK